MPPARAPSRRSSSSRPRRAAPPSTACSPVPLPLGASTRGAQVEFNLVGRTPFDPTVSGTMPPSGGDGFAAAAALRAAQAAEDEHRQERQRRFEAATRARVRRQAERCKAERRGAEDAESARREALRRNREACEEHYIHASQRRCCGLSPRALPCPEPAPRRRFCATLPQQQQQQGPPGEGSRGSSLTPSVSSIYSAVGGGGGALLDLARRCSAELSCGAPVRGAAAELRWRCVPTTAPPAHPPPPPQQQQQQQRVQIQAPARGVPLRCENMDVSAPDTAPDEQTSSPSGLSDSDGASEAARPQSEPATSAAAVARLQKDRFVTALREQLLQRLKQRGVDLPELCACGAAPIEGFDPGAHCDNCPFRTSSTGLSDFCAMIESVTAHLCVA
eukprot:TRINITY_DN5388_c2_g1_i1.p1 TRINITY_DN5388_c2_g1~~TRINITY_DN5388_c2_g1_i1.p1  ORF type:complete len:414 (+),score=135.77 TRINITY_DN5388_c2_g1_i1:75-1244(+)